MPSDFREHGRIGYRMIVRACEPRCLLQDNVFYILQGNCTHEISTIELTEQDLKMNIPVCKGKY